MPEPPQSRKRAVHLTPEALDILQSALEERAKHFNPPRKLTRHLRAELLGISERTASQILSARGVDRTTLVHAFACLGITWSDTFLAAPVHTEPEEAEAIEPPSARRFSLNRRWMWLGAVCLIALCCAAWLQLNRPVPQGSWDNVSFNARFDEATTFYHRAQYKEAEKSIREGLALAEQGNHPGHTSDCLRILGDIKSAQGDLKAAKSHYIESLRLRSGVKIERAIPAIYEALGRIETRLGEYEEAKGSFLAALDGFSKFDNLPGVAEAQRGLGTVCFKLRDYKEALAWYSSARSTVRGLDQDAMLMDITGCEGLVYRDLGRLNEAKENCEACLMYWTRAKHAKWIAKSQRDLATVELKMGNRARAMTLLQESLAGFQAVGDKVGTAEVSKLLQESRVGIARSSTNPKQP